MQWYSKVEYECAVTGETLKKEEVHKNYIVIKQFKKTHYEIKYHKRIGYKIGIRTITNLCIREGKQLKLYAEN